MKVSMCVCVLERGERYGKINPPMLTLAGERERG